MSGYERLSIRRGKRQQEGLYEGIPVHLHHALEEWLRDQFGWNSSNGMRDEFMATVASALRIPVQRTYDTGGISDQIMRALRQDDDLYLDCLDAVLFLTPPRDDRGLGRILATGGSAWTVSADAKGLERRVDTTTAEAFTRATTPADAASAELAEGWAAAYGRSPNPSDAWDHAIKAAEDLLIPVVVPNQSKPNLGHVAGELKNNPQRWEFGLPANDARNNGETLEGLIRHIWPNPDRHGGANKRPPTQAEAEAALNVAILIVELCRGRLARLP